MEHNCVFCKIIKGEIPSDKVFENEKVLAFMDIAPINPGHVLIIPKEHHQSLTTVPKDFLAAMMEIAPEIGKAAMREIDGDGFNLHLSNGECAGQVVMHAHLHVIPRKVTDGFAWSHRTISYASNEERSALAERISIRMNK